MLKRILFAIILMLLFGSYAEAQSTTVSGTVADSNSQPFASGSYRIEFNANGKTGPFAWNGSTFNPSNYIFTGSLNGSGAFSGVSVPSSTSISPAGTLWKFTVCPASSSPCYATNISITGSTQNVTSQLVSPAIQVQAASYGQPTAYQDSEIVGPVVGFSYFNLTSQVLRQCTVSIPCTWVNVGGTGNPAPPQFCTQFANAGLAGFATSSATIGGSSICNGVDSISAATKHTIPYSLSVAGPRPYIDVTAYGAKGDGVTDDTTAITNAINAACANSASYGDSYEVFFPEGEYLVDQPQTPSTSPALPTCTGLHIVGANGSKQGQAFIEAPSTAIVISKGSSPNAAPMFQCIYGSCGGGVAWENISLTCYNECIATNGASVFNWKNVTLDVGYTGLTDNTPLKISNGVWFFYDGGQIITNSTTAIPGVLMTADTTSSGFTQVGLAYFTNVLWGAGSAEYIQRINDVGAPPGNFVFRNITREGSQLPFLDIENPGSFTMPAFGPVEMDNVNDSDRTGGTAGLIYVNTNTDLTGTTIRASGNGTEAAIVMNQGTLNQANIWSCQFVCSTTVVNGSGQTVQGVISQNYNGLDVITGQQGPGSGNNWQWISEPFIGSWGPAFRVCSAGASHCAVSLDSPGLMANDGTNFGNDVTLNATAQNAWDFNFSELLPPTSVTGTPTTGGSLAAGTYYYYVRTTNSPYTTYCATSTSSLSSAAVVVSGSNDAVTVTWTAPPSTGLANVYGYCVYRSTSSYPEYDQNGILVGSAVVTGTSVTDTGSGAGGSIKPPIPVYTLAHRLESNRFNIDGGINNYPDTGSVNAMVVTTPNTWPIYPSKFFLYVLAGHTNTSTAPTVNVDSLGTITIKKNSSSGLVALAANDIQASTVALLYYDGTYAELLNPATTITSGTVQSGLIHTPTVFTGSGTSATVGPTPDCTPPSTAGTYSLLFNVTSGVTDVSCPQNGLAGTAGLTGSASSYTIAYSDNEQIVVHDYAGTSAIPFSLPTPTTLGNSEFVTSVCNYSAYTDTLTPVTWTINGGSSISIPPKTCHRISVDPNNAALSKTNWISIGEGPGITPTTLSTVTNCSSSASPAVCGSASGGSVAVPTGTGSSTLTVDTSAVTASSQILLTVDDTLGTKLSVTCNSTLATLAGGYYVSARSAGTSFQITFNGTIATNPVCMSYVIVN